MQHLEDADEDGHNACYWAKAFNKKDIVDFMKKELSCLPKSLTADEQLRAQIALNLKEKGDKKKKGGKKGGKKKK